ncbi:MAG TPA: ATP-binding protein [Gaiellaceae bacterium]
MDFLSLGRSESSGIEPEYRRLFESVPGLYLVLDPDLQIVAASDSYLAATMTEREAIVGRDVFDVFPDNPDDPGATGVDNLRASLDIVRKTRKPDAMAVQQYDMRAPDGGFAVRHWSPMNSPVLDERGQLLYILHRVEDVTEFVALRDHDSAQSAEIIRRGHELQDANKLLREASDAKNEFLARMSHELRSPLTAMMGFSELLARSDLDEKQRGRLTQIQKASDHLHNLIDEVLDLSRIESGNISISPEPVALEPMFADAVELMRPIADTHQIALHDPEILSGSGYVFADAQRLKQVLINLISNAIKYNRLGGEVRVAAAPGVGERVRIEISDTGEGIDEAALSRLFVPFERLGAAGVGIEGTGLGLALSRTLVEAMGGTLEATSTPGAGSTFVIELFRGDIAKVELGGPAEDPLYAVRNYAGERTLLYVEDTVANVRLIEGILELRPNVKLIPAMFGRLGLELAHEHHPDLILLDLHLADIPGDDVLAELRRDEETRSIPIVILSADASREREPFLAAGAQAYLTKPIGMRRILEILDQFLEPPGDGVTLPEWPSSSRTSS